MNSNPFILLLLVLCFTVSFSGLCSGEDQKTALTVKKIAFTSDKGGGEWISLFCNQSCTPELSSLEGENPRVVMDMKGVFLIQTKARNVNTGGKLVKKVRSYLDEQTNILRVVLDMEPSKSYIVRPRQDPPENAYVLTIYEDISLSEQKPGGSKEAKGSPLPQEKRITILRPDMDKGIQPPAVSKSPADFQFATPQESSPAVQGGAILREASAEGRYDEALSAQRRGDHKRAEDLYQQALMLDPGHVRALNNLGVLFMDQKKKREAVALFNRAIVLKKDYVDPYYNLACLYARAEEIDESLRYLKVAMAIDRDVKNWVVKDADMKSVVTSDEFKKIMEGQKN